jgi:hypothetical protein
MLSAEQTPRARSDSPEERNSETNLNLDQQEDSPNRALGGGEVTENQEVRYASGVEPARSTNVEIQEPFPWRAFDQNGSSTGPRIPFCNDEQTTFPLRLPQSPPVGFREMVPPSSAPVGFQERAPPSSSVHEFSQFRGNHSVRKSVGDPRNVATRDSRRPKERERDKQYRRSTLSSNGLPITLATGTPGNAIVGRVQISPVPSVPSPGLGLGTAQRNNRIFQIILVYNGQSVNHQVYDSMPILTLMEEAGAIFGLDPAWIILMLFSLTPVTLRRDGLVSGPPRVQAGATVFVFEVIVSGQGQRRNFAPVPLGPRDFGPPQPPPVTAMVNSKLLAAFKLPKFGGSPRHWKA